MIVLAIAVFGFLLTPVRGSGISMQPAIDDGTLGFIDRVVYKWRAPRRADIVAVRLAGASVVYIKRVIGLPGERLAIRAGVVEVGGRPLNEPYVARRQPWEVAAFTLAGDEYFVIGDNRSMRADDHDFGKVRRERILGVVRVW